MLDTPKIIEIAKKWNKHCREYGYDVSPINEDVSFFKEIARLCFNNEDPYEYVDREYPYLEQDEYFCDIIEYIIRNI